MTTKQIWKTWKFNEYGNVEIWNKPLSYDEIQSVPSDEYIQDSQDVEYFFERIGYNIDEIHVNDFDLFQDEGE